MVHRSEYEGRVLCPSQVSSSVAPDMLTETWKPRGRTGLGLGSTQYEGTKWDPMIGSINETKVLKDLRRDTLIG